MGLIERFCRGVPEPKIKIYDCGAKRISDDAFPFVAHLVSDGNKLFAYRKV